MSNLRKAAEMALEALMQKGEHHPKVYQAAEALRQALAQPEQEATKQAYLDGVNSGVKAERERCAKIALSGTGEPIQVATLEILRKERERIAANIMEIER